MMVLVVMFTTIGLYAKENVTIRRNQVGSAIGQEQTIVVEGTNPAGKLKVTSPSGKTIKPVMTKKVVSPFSKKTRYVVGLGKLTEEGDYNVRLGKEKCDLHVSNRPYGSIATSSLRLFYLIRSGVVIDCAGKYNRPVGHTDTNVLVHPSAASPLRPAGTIISSPYGWYDAGDYNKYVVNSAFSIGLMLAAYEQLPDYFAALNTNIPESGNKTPDLLDEMMFNLQWFFSMQDPYDGGVYHKLTTPNFEAFIMPKDCRQPRFVVQKTVTATLDFAAVMADAARLYEPFSQDYPGFSAQAAAVAERAYQWAKANPTAFYHQERLKEPAVTTGAYGDGSARDEFFWAASALYRLTGKQQYLDDVRQYQPAAFTTPTWGNVASLGAFEWLAAGDKSALYEPMLQQLVAYCDGAVKDVDKSCFQSPYGNSARDFGWGCLAECFGAGGMALLYAYQQTGNGKYLTAALQNAEYILGRNATGYCYVTGFGSKPTMNPHHRLSAADGIEDPIPGFLAGGPNPGQQDKASNISYPSNQPDESYADVTESYASNEIAINWNGCLVGLFGWLDAVEK